MKKSKFSKQQIAFILKRAVDGTTVEKVCRKACITVQTYLSMTKQIWRVDAFGDEAFETA